MSNFQNLQSLYVPFFQNASEVKTYSMSPLLSLLLLYKEKPMLIHAQSYYCLLYTSDAADDWLVV